MRKTEKEARNQYFLAVYIVILAVTTLLGTAVMVVGPKCRQWWRSCWRSHMYERLRVSFRESRREVYSRVSPEDEGDDQGDEECPESCERAVHVTTQRLWTAGAFACTAIACTATCIYSLQSDRLDKNSGLDWELYVGLMLGGALCLLSQAVLAVLLLPKDLSFPVTAFAESAFVYLMPFVSDGFDTLKDIIFSCLCVQSDHLLLKGIGVASWIYLMVIHGILIMQDNTLAELAGCYLPALMALPADPASEDSISSCCPGLSCQHLSDMFCQLLYKQVTPTKRELLLWENVPQGVAAIFFLYFEGGSLFVGVINLAIPVGQVLATFVFFRPLRNLVAPQFGKKLSGFLSKPDFLRAQLLWEEAFEKDRELLRVALPTLLRTPRLEELVREVQTEELADSKEGFEFIQGFIEFVVKNEGVPDSNQRRDMLHEEAQKGTVVAVKVLLAATPVDATDNVGETALHKAAREGKTEVAKLLVDAKAALDAKNRSGHTPLHQAAWNGHLEVAKLLAPPAFTYSRLAHALAAEKNCHSKALEGLDLLHRVLPRLQNVPPLSDFMKHVQPKGIDDDRMLHFWHGYISQLINEKGEVDLSEVYFIQATDENGNNMLHLAAEQGHLEAVKFLLNAKAPVDAPAHFGETALRKAAREGKTEVASLLVVAKAALDAKNHSGETALHKAAREGKTEVAKLLVDAKAALDAKNRSGHTPLHQAAWNGHLEVAKLLAPPAFTYSQLACMLAALKGQSKAKDLDFLRGVLPRLQQVPPLSDFMKHVQPKGIDGDRMLHFWESYISQLINEKGEVDLSEVYFLKATDANGNNMLHLAAEQGHQEAVEFLLNAKAPVDEPGRFGRNPLHRAAIHGLAEVAGLLLAAKASVDAKSNGHETPLHHAAANGRGEVARLLLGASAAVDAKSGFGETPLHHAAGEGRGDLVRLLLGARAAVDAKSGCSETPLDAARNSGHTEVVRILEAAVSSEQEIQMAPTKGKGKQHGQKSAAAHTRGSDAS